VLSALDKSEIAIRQVVTDVVTISTDIEVWTPGEAAVGEVWTGLVVAEAPVGPQPCDGDIIVNGERTLVCKGVFEGLKLTKIGTRTECSNAKGKAQKTLRKAAEKREEAAASPEAVLSICT